MLGGGVSVGVSVSVACRKCDWLFCAENTKMEESMDGEWNYMTITGSEGK